MRTRSEADIRSAERKNEYQARLRRARATLEKLGELKSLNDDRTFRKQAEALIDEGLGGSFSEADLQPLRPKGFRFLVFHLVSGACIGHGGNRANALSNARVNVPVVTGEYEILEFPTNSAGRDVWENRSSLADAKRIAVKHSGPRISESGINTLIAGSKKMGVSFGSKDVPKHTLRWLKEEGYIVKQGGAWFTTDAGMDVLRANGVKV